MSLYPLETADSDRIIQAAISDLGAVNAQVGELSTFLSGSEEEVFSALRKLFANAVRKGGEVAMVATVKNR